MTKSKYTMGGICSKKAKEVRVHELAFMGVCTEGAYNQPELLDQVYQQAVDAGCRD